MALSYPSDGRLPSACGLDYRDLEQLLSTGAFQAADQLTLKKMCVLAGPLALKRGWIYFTEVNRFPTVDLRTIDELWVRYSQEKFGFSVQRQVWLSTGKNWDLLWDKIGWKKEDEWTRYPQGFTWDLSAPKGHLPLSNQLRGVRVISTLLAHPAWSDPS